MKLAEKLWQYVSLLSIDVVLGAMAGQMFFSRLLRVEVEASMFLLLGLAVWSIYTGDHLWDAIQAKELRSPRHRFHASHRKSLSLGLILSILAGLALAFQTLGLEKEFIWSLMLGIVIFLTMYLLRKAGRASGYLKELSTAVFYVLGISWIPILRADLKDLLGKPLLFLLFFAALAFMNLWMLAIMDQEDDQAQGFPSMAGLLDSHRLILGVRKFNFFLIIIGLAGFILLNSYFRPFASVLLLIALVHYLIFFRAKISQEEKRKRMEASFLLPWLLLVL
ncbi:MAG: UbiA family prenyltransferase [Cyclobacteriaceae bacterium]|nr:UbiA family prenyltransferase [Cyclobacteriaceae bacterium]MDX5465856.1 UbiA family prenyltransferase [Cyclobacteriaceae bacterium]